MGVYIICRTRMRNLLVSMLFHVFSFTPVVYIIAMTVNTSTYSAVYVEGSSLEEFLRLKRLFRRWKVLIDTCSSVRPIIIFLLCCSAIRRSNVSLLSTGVTGSCTSAPCIPVCLLCCSPIRRCRITLSWPVASVIFLFSSAF